MGRKGLASDLRSLPLLRNHLTRISTLSTLFHRQQEDIDSSESQEDTEFLAESTAPVWPARNGAGLNSGPTAEAPRLSEDPIFEEIGRSRWGSDVAMRLV